MINYSQFSFFFIIQNSVFFLASSHGIFIHIFSLFIWYKYKKSQTMMLKMPRGIRNDIIFCFNCLLWRYFTVKSWSSDSSKTFNVKTFFFLRKIVNSITCHNKSSNSIKSVQLTHKALQVVTLIYFHFVL